MKKPNEGLWYDAVTLDNMLRTLINQKSPPSSKGVLPCPECEGTLLWCKDYQGLYYVRCYECRRLIPN